MAPHRRWVDGPSATGPQPRRGRALEPRGPMARQTTTPYGGDPSAQSMEWLRYAKFSGPWENTAKFLNLSASLAFGGTSGFTIYPDEEEACLSTLATRARPTSQCGFPFSDKRCPVGSDGHGISTMHSKSLIFHRLSKYIVKKISYRFILRFPLLFKDRKTHV